MQTCHVHRCHHKCHYEYRLQSGVIQNNSPPPPLILLDQYLDPQLALASLFPQSPPTLPHSPNRIMRYPPCIMQSHIPAGPKRPKAICSYTNPSVHLLPLPCFPHAVLGEQAGRFAAPDSPSKVCECVCVCCLHHLAASPDLGC
jgi:hypothetical protein